jgi:transposase InsO family protein
MLFYYYHTSPLGGHLGIFKTINKIRENFIWKSMDRDIPGRVLHCTLCGLSKPAQNTRFGLLASEVAERPFQKVFIDVGKFPRSRAGNTMILVRVDAFSKFVWLIHVREATTLATVKALRNRVFSAFSVPGVLVSDNAKCFVSRKFRQFCFGLGIKHITTTPYYPQPSHAERFNRNLRSALIAFHSDSQTTWDKNLSWLQPAFNTATHKYTGATPFQVMFPFRAGSPLLHQWGSKIFRTAVLRAASVDYGAVFVATFFIVMRLWPGGKTAGGYLILLTSVIWSSAEITRSVMRPVM